jgi:hypothetical protein
MTGRGWCEVRVIGGVGKIDSENGDDGDSDGDGDGVVADHPQVQHNNMDSHKFYKQHLRIRINAHNAAAAAAAESSGRMPAHDVELDRVNSSSSSTSSSTSRRSSSRSSSCAVSGTGVDPPYTGHSSENDGGGTADGHKAVAPGRHVTCVVGRVTCIM